MNSLWNMMNSKCLLSNLRKPITDQHLFEYSTNIATQLFLQCNVYNQTNRGIVVIWRRRIKNVRSFNLYKCIRYCTYIKQTWIKYDYLTQISCDVICALLWTNHSWIGNWNRLCFKEAKNRMHNLDIQKH